VQNFLVNAGKLRVWVLLVHTLLNQFILEVIAISSCLAHLHCGLNNAALQLLNVAGIVAWRSGSLKLISIFQQTDKWRWPLSDHLERFCFG
jgi:hypothetical protein